jgi:hypothetical protein
VLSPRISFTLTGLTKNFGEMVLIAPRIFISILSISLISNNIAASASLLAKRGAASLASPQASSLHSLLFSWLAFLVVGDG